MKDYEVSEMPLRLAILSDLHLDTADYDGPMPEADVLVLAGDISVGAKGVEWAARLTQYEAVIYVLGNHEYYGGVIGGRPNELLRAASGTNVRVLQRDTVMIEGVTFLGCTLWSDFRYGGTIRAAMAEAERRMRDFAAIRVEPMYRRLRARDVAATCQGSLRWMSRCLGDLSDARTVVVTHHAPSPRSLGGRGRDDLDGAYCSDLEAFIRRFQPSLWVHGHIHHPSSYRVGRTQVVCNPRGYQSERVDGFLPSLVLEV